MANDEYRVRPKKRAFGDNNVTLSYPSEVGDIAFPAWIKFGIYDRNVTTRGKLLRTIGLYMPERASMPSTVSWENEKIGYKSEATRKQLGNLIAGYSSNTGTGGNALMVDLGNDFTGTVTQLASQAKDRANTATGLDSSAYKSISAGALAALTTAGGASLAAAGLSKLGAAAGVTTQDGNPFSPDQILGLTTGTIRNPYLTAMFRGVDFRTFEFTFTFFPHNQKESDEIVAIIREFRRASLPKYQSGKALLDYPNEFDIAYMWGTNEQRKIHKFKPSVLTGIDTNYTGYGSWTVMKDGLPASIVVSLRFSELEIVTRDDVDMGY